MCQVIGNRFTLKSVTFTLPENFDHSACTNKLQSTGMLEFHLYFCVLRIVKIQSVSRI